MKTAPKFGRRVSPVTVQEMKAREPGRAVEWNTVQEWAGAAAIVTPAMRQTVARIAAQ